MVLNSDLYVRMAGSTMDAMSDAIEGADVMLYGVSLRYKESANVSASRRHEFQSKCAAADLTLIRVWMVIFVRVMFSVPIGSQLRSSAGAGHDPTDDAKGL
jgi:hypothetical protein